MSAAVDLLLSLQWSFPVTNCNWHASMIQRVLATGMFMDVRAMLDCLVDFKLEDEGIGAVQ